MRNELSTLVTLLRGRHTDVRKTEQPDGLLTFAVASVISSRYVIAQKFRQLQEA
jgi:hypothetical protein